jgi:hypothetical protein
VPSLSPRALPLADSHARPKRERAVIGMFIFLSHSCWLTTLHIFSPPTQDFGRIANPLAPGMRGSLYTLYVVLLYCSYLDNTAYFWQKNLGALVTMSSHCNVVVKLGKLWENISPVSLNLEDIQPISLNLEDTQLISFNLEDTQPISLNLEDTQLISLSLEQLDWFPSVWKILENFYWFFLISVV